jgi:tRNA threonylcarbamoyladenosine biosynthesis protein TsaB
VTRSLGADELVLALETSSRTASVAARLGASIVERQLESDRAHASDLLPALDALVRELGAAPRDVRAVLVGTGPGSFTGLRVGIATALGLARACGARARGVPSGETLVFEHLEPGAEAVHLLDARSGALFFAHYRRSAHGVEVLAAPCALTPEELALVLPAGVPIFGDESAARAAGLSAADLARYSHARLPGARALLALGAALLEELGDQPLASIEPLYLRPFNATRRKR